MAIRKLTTGEKITLDAPAPSAGVAVSAPRTTIRKVAPTEKIVLDVTPAPAPLNRDDLARAMESPETKLREPRRPIGHILPERDALDNDLNPQPTGDFNADVSARMGINPNNPPPQVDPRFSGTIAPVTGPEPGIMSVLKGAGQSLETGVRTTEAGLRRQFGDMMSGVASRGLLGDNAVSDFLMVGPGDQTGWQQFSEGAGRDIAGANLQQELVDPEFEATTGQGLYGGLTSLVQNAPGVAASIATGSAVPALALAGAQTESEAYNRYRDQGAAPAKALLGAAGAGGVEVATEMLPMGFIVQKFGKAGAKQFIAGLLLRDLPGEQVATLAQDAIDTAMDQPNKTWAEYVAERPGAAYQTLLGSLVQAGAMGALDAGAKAIQPSSGLVGEANVVETPRTRIAPTFSTPAPTPVDPPSQPGSAPSMEPEAPIIVPAPPSSGDVLPIRPDVRVPSESPPPVAPARPVAVPDQAPEPQEQAVPLPEDAQTAQQPDQIPEVARKVEAAAATVNTSPTEGQKEAGNYKKGHVRIAGLPISIENPKGSQRSGRDKDGNAWSVEMPVHYGYVKRTEGADGDQVDVFIGDNPDSDKVFVVDQINPDDGKFDEHKALIGFDSIQQAVDGYAGAFSDGRAEQRLGNVTIMTMPEFKDWLANKKTKKPLTYKRKPAPVKKSLTTEQPATGKEPLQVDQTDVGAQTVIPGAERATDATMAQRGADAPMRARKPQESPDEGLFDTAARGQQDMISALGGAQAIDQTVGILQASPEQEKSPEISARQEPALETKAAARGRPDNLVRKPMTLRGFIRKNGGVRDADGVLATGDLQKDSRFKGVIRANGMAPDKMARLARDAGYFRADDPNRPDELTVDDLYQALLEESRGTDRYSDRDADRVEDQRNRAQTAQNQDLEDMAVSKWQERARELWQYDIDRDAALRVEQLVNDGVDEWDAVTAVVERLALEDQAAAPKVEKENEAEPEEEIPFDSTPAVARRTPGPVEQPAETVRDEPADREPGAEPPQPEPTDNQSGQAGSAERAEDVKQQKPKKKPKSPKESPPDFPKAAASAVDRVLVEGKKSGKEHMEALDATGQTISVAEGGAVNYVAIPGDLMARLKKKDEKATIVHNHPSGDHALSNQDVAMFYLSGLDMMVAATDKGGFSAATRGPAFYATDKSATDFLRLLDDASAAVKRDLAQQIMAIENATNKQKSIIFHEIMNRSFARNGLIEYYSNFDPAPYFAADGYAAAQAQADDVVLGYLNGEKAYDDRDHIPSGRAWTLLDASGTEALFRQIRENAERSDVPADKGGDTQRQGDDQDKPAQEVARKKTRTVAGQEMPEPRGATLAALRRMETKASEALSNSDNLTDDQFYELEQYARDIESEIRARAAGASPGPDPVSEPATETQTEEPEAQDVQDDDKPDSQEAIQDFGEKILGARKDVWEAYQKAMAEELPADAKDITLSKHFPQPDYEDLIARGTDIRILAAVKAMRDEIPTKPQKSWKLQDWAKKVKNLRQFSNDLLSGRYDMDYVMAKMDTNERGLRGIAERIRMYADLGYPAFTQAKDWNVHVSHGVYENGVKLDRPQWFMAKNNSWGTRFETREEAINALREHLNKQPETNKKSVKLDIYRDTRTGDIIIGKKVGAGKYIDLKTGFEKSRDARLYLSENMGELLALLEQKKTLRPERRSVNDPRKGEDYRKGEDIRPERFASEFGFRGVQFGNYVEQKKRAADLNNAYDALLDLSSLLNIPARAVSLNGKLGLAFGARGHGGKGAPSAHYEPGNVVINLTKNSGAGSLGHEWWHALDNYFGKQNKGQYLTDSPYQRKSMGADGKPVIDETVRAEVIEAFFNVMKAINKTDLKKRSKERDKTRSKDYWSTDIEMSARAFESYLIDRAAKKGESNDYLANIIGEEYHEAQKALEGQVSDYPYLTGEEMETVGPAFDALFSALKTRETEAGVELFEPQEENFTPRNTDTQAFKDWFGDSKVVDDNGEPLVVYHGTSIDIQEFKSSRTGKGSSIFGDYDVERYGVFATPDRDLAQEFSPNGKLMPLYMSIKNPFDMVNAKYTNELFSKIEKAAEEIGSDNGFRTARVLGDFWGGDTWQMFDKDNYNEPDFWIKLFKHLGYDGAIIHEPPVLGDGKYGVSFVAFDPEQIKSVFNRGTFDPADANILRESGEEEFGSESERARSDLLKEIAEARARRAAAAEERMTANRIKELETAAARVKKALSTAKDASTVDTLQNSLDAINRELDRLIVDQEGVQGQKLATTATETRRANRAEDAIKIANKAFARASTATKKDVKSIQAQLIRAIEDSGLDAADRAKFTAEIKNMQTAERMRRRMPEIQERMTALLERSRQRAAIAKIRKTMARVKKSKIIAVDFVKQIEALVSEIDLQKRTEATTKALTETLKFMNANPDAKMPRATLKKLERLNKESMENISAYDLEQLHEAIVELIDQGKTKYELLQKRRERQRDERLEEIAEGSTPMWDKPLKRAAIGESLEAADKLRNKYAETANNLTALGRNINPMDVFFDMLDGNGDYKGPNHRIFKQTVDRSFGRYLDKREDSTRAVKDLTDELDLNEKNFERIGAWAVLQQEGGYDKLKNSGITDQEINSLELTADEMRMYELMRRKLDDMLPGIKEVMRVVYNKDVEAVKDYFPFMTDFDAMEDFQVQDMIGDGVPQIGRKKDVEAGFAKSRTLGKQKVRIDALGVFLKHMDNAAYLVEMGKDIRELGEVATSTKYGEAVGDAAQEAVVQWINLLARKGNVPGRINLLDNFRINTGAAMLAFKLSSILIQPTALADGSALIGGDYVARGIADVTNREWREFLKKNLPELRERIGDDPAYLDMGGDTMIKKAQRAGFWALQNMDLMSASAIAAGAYRRAVEAKGEKVDLNNPDPEAIMEAQLMMRRTQSSAFAKDAAPAISRGGVSGNVSLDRLLFQFQSFMFNRWSLMKHDMYRLGFKQGKTAKALNIAAWLVLANASEIMIRDFAKDVIRAIAGDEEEPEKDPAIKMAILQALNNVPFVSQVMSLFKWGSMPVPSLGLLKSVGDRAVWAARSKKWEKKAQHYTEAAILALGAAFGVPGTLQAEDLFRRFLKEKKMARPDPRDRDAMREYNRYKAEQARDKARERAERARELARERSDR